MPLRLSADNVREALDRADSRHWTRNPPRSMRARLTYLLKHYEPAALARRLQTTPSHLDALLGAQQVSEDQPLHQAVEREIVRIWQPRVRRRAHATILASGGQMTLSFRAWLGFTATAGSSDDPRLRFLSLHLDAPYPKRLFTARRIGAPESELQAILNDAFSTCYFHRGRPAHLRESVSLDRIDFLEFYY
ncbi:telomere-protecting terminal protein Tpg [Streptomyces capoamus]|uniref:telomere-protecting terminal protein Tpg n=1 Tax=Streptomyces capoamus TaxID=68183 RepID=UPI003392A5F3